MLIKNEIENFLQLASQHFTINDPIFFETSIKFSEYLQQLNGRIIIWLKADKEKYFSAIKRFLETLDAPHEVKIAQQQQNSLVQGISIESKNGVTNYRLYLHVERDKNQKDRIDGWRWGESIKTQFHQYKFYFLPETPNGEKPLDFIPNNLKNCVAQILSTQKLQQMSGFWLRKDKEDKVSQIYFVFPWNPKIEKISGIVDALQILKIEETVINNLKSQPIRHLAFSVNQPIQSLTFYTSATLKQFPKNEFDLHRRLIKNARNDNIIIQRNIFDWLPPFPKIQLNNEVEDSYNAPIEIWRTILGKDMYYHAGIFETSLPYTETDINMAFKKAVTSLFKFIPLGCRLYDIGCGWGSSLALITKDLGCSSIGITSSRTQYRYISSLGLPVRLGNAEHTLPPGKFDVILMLESFTHIKNKLALLQTIRHFSNRLIMRVNCQDVAPPSQNLGDSMFMISSTHLREILIETGWNIKHWKDVRTDALPSVKIWHDRLQSIPPTKDKQIETLRFWSNNVLKNLNSWGSKNPLIELVAE